MAANVYLKSVILNTNYVHLADAPLVLDATLIASRQNTSNATVRHGGSVEVSWPPGATVELRGVDLSQFEVKGPPGGFFLVVGHTPRVA